MKKIILSIFAATALFGADKAEDFKAINADIAHQSNITGNGINIGVIDSAANQNHQSLKGKIAKQIYSQYNGKDYEPDFYVDTHGSHVTSIIVGNGTLVKGLAYNAMSYNVQLTGNNIGSGSITPTKQDIYNYFVSNNVIAINNSVNTALYPLINIKDMIYYPLYANESPSYWINAASSEGLTKDLMRLSSNNKSVVVFAAGNEGMSSPGLLGLLRGYDESLKTWITVGAFDSEWATVTNGSVTRLSKYALANFSNGFIGAQSYGIIAPGKEVIGADASSISKTRKSSGTSQATPYVTAAAALVKEKFSFLEPNQITDVILSTANQNFSHPDVIYKEITKKVLNESKTALEERTFYTIFYIDKKIPRKDDSTIDLEQVRKDLSSSGYNSGEINSVLNQRNSLAYYNEVLMSSDPVTDLNELEKFAYPQIQEVSFADVFGQGILDVGKAMGGLGKLDANRMSASDIETRNGEKQAIYKINTGASNAEFSNDISQVKWNSAWHLENALNSQKALSSVEKIGLEKQGAGILTLSGQNTYLGDTIVSGGELVLSGSLSDSYVFAKNSTIFTLKNGTIGKNANVENGATFRGIGTISGDFTNNGILKAGFYDDKSDELSSINTLNVIGKYTQIGDNSKLQLAFGKNDALKNSIFKAGSYDIKAGGLEYVPLQTAKNLFSAGEIINLSLDESFSKQLNNFKISALSSNLLVFDMNEDGKSFTVKNKTSQDEQGKTLNKGDVKIPDPTPDSGGGSGSDQGGSGSGGSAGGGSGSGSGSGSGTGSGDSGTGGGSGSGGESGGQGGQGQNPGQNPNPQPNIPINPANPNQGTLIGALQGMLGKENINKTSKELLATLDNMSQGDFQRATKSLSDSPTSTTNRAIETLENSLNIKNTLFLIDSFDSLGSLNTNSVVFAPTAAFGDEYLGKVDDIYIKTQLSGGIAYRQTKHDDYDQKAYLADIQAKKALSDITELGGFFGLGHAKTDKDDSKIKSNMFSLGLSVKHDLGAFGVLGSLSGGLSFNRYEHSIFGVNDKSTAKYKNYFFSAQAGVYKNIALSENFVISPLALLNYSYIRQDSFSENRAGLSRYFSAQNTNHTRAFVGANFAYQNMVANHEITTSFYAFYWQKFGARNTNENISFTEAKELKFTNTSKADKNGFYGGVSLQVKRNNKFVRISISDEKAKNYNQFEAMLRMGINF